MRRLLVATLASISITLYAQTPAPPPADSSNRSNLTINVEPLGDNADGVVSRVTFRFAVPSDVPSGVPLVIQGSI
ncbi:MAG: hypothetical protein ACXW29_02860, partial [Thermoanaerobaculia bacterium]